MTKSEFIEVPMTKMHSEDDWRIRINGGEPHPLAHAHVEYRDGSRVSVAIESLAVLTGVVRPVRRLNDPLAWVAAHKEELIAEYWRLNK
jgi:hypothetical protein